MVTWYGCLWWRDDGSQWWQIEGEAEKIWFGKQENSFGVVQVFERLIWLYMCIVSN